MEGIVPATFKTPIRIFPPRPVPNFGLKFQGAIQRALVVSDPYEWQSQNLGVQLFSNQYDITNEVFDTTSPGFNVLGCRGSGKTQGVSWAYAALCSTRPNTHVICTAPIRPQAGRIIKYVKLAMQSESSKVRNLIDWQGSSALRLVWKNGNTMVGVSGQERASVEGEHGNHLIIDEAHLVPNYSVKNKLMPMLVGMGATPKVVKIGVAMGKGHFYDTFNAEDAHNCLCPWNKAEIFLMEDQPLFYKGRQISRHLLRMMPRVYREKHFPDRPDLTSKLTGLEISIQDWQTQYELEWIDDINSFLSGDEHEELGNGSHGLMTRGHRGERYIAGLDTSHSMSHSGDTDWTVLAIWRLNRDGTMDKVASFRWRYQILEQKEEIFDIIHPKDGLFPCEIIFADYSNVGIEVVEEFRKKRIPIAGVAFQNSAKGWGSVKNFKNTIFNRFEIDLQSGMVHYPEMKAVHKGTISDDPDTRTQCDNMQKDFNEWGVLQRIRRRGLNDDICSPKELSGDEEDGDDDSLHDDGPCADALAVFAMRHLDRVKKEMAKSGNLSGYQIPRLVTSHITTAGAFAPGGNPMAKSAGGENPMAGRERSRSANVMAGEDSLPKGDPQAGDLSGFMKVNRRL